MESLIFLAVLIFVVAPIATAFSVSGINRKLDDLQRNVTALKTSVDRLAADISSSAPDGFDEEAQKMQEAPVFSTETVEPPAAEIPEIPEIQKFPDLSEDAANLLRESPQVAASQIHFNNADDTPIVETFDEEGETNKKTGDTPATQPDSQEYDEIDAETPDEEHAAPASTRAPFALPFPKPALPQMSWFEGRLRHLASWLLSEGNIWVSVGVVLFLAGFGLLFSYVAQMNLISLEMRLAGAAAVGVGMTAFGWKMRTRRRTYALILQGGGIGVLYIVLLAGAKFGGVIPPAAAVAGMVMLSTFTVLLAILQDFELLAAFALLGGYTAPILVSTGSDNFVALFAIYSMLNLEILFISACRDWRTCRWGGLLASVAVGAIWGTTRWQPEYFSRVEPFLIVFFVNYTLITLLPMLAWRAKYLRNRSRIDLPMILTLPFAFMALQIPATHHTAYGTAISALAVGLWYMLLGRAATTSEEAKRAGYSPRLFLAYCIVFSNLAIPFIFRQAASSAIWAAEGAVLIALAARGGGLGTMACGLFMHAAAVALYTLSPAWSAGVFHVAVSHKGLFGLSDPTSPFLVAGIVFAAATMASSYFATRFPHIEAEGDARRVVLWRFHFNMPNPVYLARLFAVCGTIWSTLAALHAGFVRFPDSFLTPQAILYALAAVGYALSLRLKWNQARYLAAPPVAFILWSFVINALFTWPVTSSRTLYFVYDILLSILGWHGGVSSASSPWTNMAITLPTAAAMFALGVMAYRRDAAPSRLRRATWGCLLVACIHYAYGAVVRILSLLGVSSPGMAALVLAALTALAAALFVVPKFRNRTRMEAYRAASLRALVALMLVRLPAFVQTLAALYATTALPATSALYIPILNPLELSQLLYLATAGLLFSASGRESVRRIGLRYALPFAAFIWMNCVAARIALFYFDEIARFGNLTHSPHFQGIIAILWGLTALALIFSAKRFATRLPWFMGAILLGLDIVKLMLIDLRNSATVIRIFAFLLLGGLFLLIGWVAPLPPKNAPTEKVKKIAEQDDDEEDKE